jgi:hypothetical protein
MYHWTFDVICLCNDILLTCVGYLVCSPFDAGGILKVYALFDIIDLCCGFQQKTSDDKVTADQFGDILLQNP